MSSGKCLNGGEDWKVRGDISKSGTKPIRPEFKAWYRDYGNRVWSDPFSSSHAFTKGKVLKYAKGKLTMYRNKDAEKPLWTYPGGNDGYVVSDTHILRLVVPLRDIKKCQIICADMPTGVILWNHQLPGKPIQHGLATDSDGRIIISLEDGSIVCFELE